MQMLDETTDTRTFHSLIDEIQDTTVPGSTKRQVRALARMADLFAAGSSRYSEQQIGLFDEVFKTLVAVIELKTRIKLARHLATNPAAPATLVRVGEDLDLKYLAEFHSIPAFGLVRTPDLIKFNVVKRRVRITTIRRYNGRPYDDYDGTHVEIVRSCGFAAAVSTAWGAATRRSDRYQLPRLMPWDKTALRFAARLLRARRELSATAVPVPAN